MIGLRSATVNFMAQFICETGPRNIQTFTANVEETWTEILQLLINRTVRGFFHCVHRCQFLDLQNPHLRIRNCDIKARWMRHQPNFDWSVSLHVSEVIFIKPKHHAIHKHTTLQRTGNSVIPTPLIHLRNFASLHMLQKYLCVRTWNFSRLFRAFKKLMFLAWAPIFFDIILIQRDLKIPTSIYTAYQTRVLCAFSKWGLSKTESANPDCIFKIGCLLKSTQYVHLFSLISFKPLYIYQEYCIEQTLLKRQRIIWMELNQYA